jgi:hypothetical protein
MIVRVAFAIAFAAIATLPAHAKKVCPPGWVASSTGQSCDPDASVFIGMSKRVEEAAKRGAREREAREREARERGLPMPPPIVACKTYCTTPPFSDDMRCNTICQ